MDWFRRLLRRQPEEEAVNPGRIREYFNQAAADDEHYPESIDPRIYHVKLLLEHLGNLDGKRVADIGCGKGRFARILKERNPGAEIIAVDLAEAMLRFAPMDLQRCAASMTLLPLRDESCDAAYATESLEHAVNIERAVAELCRILKAGGRLVIIDKNADHWGKLATPEWERWFGRRELEKLLQRHCRVVSSQLISYWEDVKPDGLFVAWFAEK